MGQLARRHFNLELLYLVCLSFYFEAVEVFGFMKRLLWFWRIVFEIINIQPTCPLHSRNGDISHCNETIPGNLHKSIKIQGLLCSLFVTYVNTFLSFKDVHISYLVIALFVRSCVHYYITTYLFLSKSDDKLSFRCSSL